MRNAFKRTILSWIGDAPSSTKKVALLIPQYNEWSNGSMKKRLDYFASIAQKYNEYLDVILIDDGSLDKSLRVIKEFKQRKPDSFYLASISPNANKVGALYLTASSIHHEMVILSDFDTDLFGLQDCHKILETLRSDDSLMGYYFRMLPFDGAGNIFDFQRMDYTLQRSLYKFSFKERTVAVMPGAGSCFKREVLLEIYHQHSGLRNGEDREATLIGLKMGYRTFYWDKVHSLTRTPMSFNALVKQRTRWNLGYIETFYKESKFYFLQCRQLSRFGLRTLFDIFDILFVIMLPFILIAISIFKVEMLVPFLIFQYLLYFVYCFNLIFITSPRESAEFVDKRIQLLLYFPILKLALDYLSWSHAFLKFLKARPPHEMKQSNQAKNSNAF